MAGAVDDPLILVGDALGQPLQHASAFLVPRAIRSERINQQHVGIGHSRGQAPAEHAQVQRRRCHRGHASGPRPARRQPLHARPSQPMEQVHGQKTDHGRQRHDAARVRRDEVEPRQAPVGDGQQGQEHEQRPPIVLIVAAQPSARSRQRQTDGQQSQGRQPQGEAAGQAHQGGSRWQQGLGKERWQAAHAESHAPGNLRTAVGLQIGAHGGGALIRPHIVLIPFVQPGGMGGAEIVPGIAEALNVVDVKGQGDDEIAGHEGPHAPLPHDPTTIVERSGDEERDEQSLPRHLRQVGQASADPSQSPPALIVHPPDQAGPGNKVQQRQQGLRLRPWRVEDIL